MRRWLQHDPLIVGLFVMASDMLSVYTIRRAQLPEMSACVIAAIHMSPSRSLRKEDACMSGRFLSRASIGLARSAWVHRTPVVAVCATLTSPELPVHNNSHSAPLRRQTMNHGDHGEHGGSGEHGGAPAGPTCSLNMLWNTQIEDTCIVFRSWHIPTKSAFVFSWLVIVGLGVLYEYLRVAQRNVDRRIAATLSAQGKGKATAGASGSVSGRDSPEIDSEEAGLLTGSLVVKGNTG